MMAFSGRSKNYTLALIAVFIPILFFFGRVYRSASTDSVHAGRAQIYVSVKDDAAKPVPNASVQLMGGDSKITNEAGLARLDVGRNSVSHVRVSASGFKEAELSVQGSSIDPNKLIVLSPTTKEPSTQDHQGSSSPVESYVETVRSGPEESGLGNDFSPWYRLVSPVAKDGYVVDSWDYTLSGDRRCNEWSECRLTSTDNQVIFSFRMQGHSEWVPPHPGMSEGVLRVQYKPLSLLSNTELKKLVIGFAGRLHRKDSVMLDHLQEISRLQDVLENPTTRQSVSATDNVKREIAANQQASNNEIYSVVQTDVPLANLYLTELLKRLGPQHGPITTFSAAPNMPSIDAFLGKSLYLYDLANQLQP